MKGIVLETNEKEAAVLFDNGTVSKIKNRHYGKGQVINMNNKFKFIAKAGSIAAALAITTATGFAYTTPSTYVSLDVNPSIEYQLNAFDRVISVIAVNEDGEKIVNELNVNNDKIQKAIFKTVEKLKAEGYLTNEDYAGIVIAVSNKSEEKSEKLTSEIKGELNKDDDMDEEVLEEADAAEADAAEEAEEAGATHKDKEEIEVSVQAVGKDRVEEARKLNVTPGKLNLVQKLIESTDEFDEISEKQLEELLSLSVKEINKMTQAYKKCQEVDFSFLDEKEITNEDGTEETVKVNKEDKEYKEEIEDENEQEAVKNDKNVKKDKESKEEKEKSNNGKALGKEKNN